MRWRTISKMVCGEGNHQNRGRGSRGREDGWQGNSGNNKGNNKGRVTDMAKRRCYECGRGTDNLDGECSWCKDVDDFEGPGEYDGDDDTEGMERDYERYIGRT